MARKFSIPQHQVAELVTDQATIGRMAKAARTSQELRIDHAAGLLNVSVALLSALESGADRAISLKKILDVLDGLGLSLRGRLRKRKIKHAKPVAAVAAA